MKNKYFVTILFFSVLIITGCSGNNSSSTGSNNSPMELITNAEIITKTSTLAPYILHQGKVILAANETNDFRLTKCLFDFDENRIIDERKKVDGWDIGFGIAVGRDSDYLVVGPSENSRVAYLDVIGDYTDDGSFIFNLSDCLDPKTNYGKGGNPIPAYDSIFCWITDKGRVVEIIVDEIIKIPGEQHLYQIELNYVVWNYFYAP